MSIEKVLIRWRVARKLPDQDIAQLVGYVDGRQVMTMLDELDPSWSVSHSPLAIGDLVGVQADLTVKGITRSDVGVPSNQDPLKGAYSDALKRAAVHFGIGRELYELPQVYAHVVPQGRSYVPDQKPTFNEVTGRWEIDPPGWVWYLEEERNQPGDPLTDGTFGGNITLKIAPASGTVGVDKKEEIKRLARRLGFNRAALEEFAVIQIPTTVPVDLANLKTAAEDKLIAALTAAAVEASTGGKLE